MKPVHKSQAVPAPRALRSKQPTKSVQQTGHVLSQSLHLDIGRIAVEGLDAGQQERFVRALEARLTQLAGNPAIRDALAAGSLHMRTLRAGTMRAGASPEEAARLVARSLERHLLQNTVQPVRQGAEDPQAAASGGPHA